MSLDKVLVPAAAVAWLRFLLQKSKYGVWFIHTGEHYVRMPDWLRNQFPLDEVVPNAVEVGDPHFPGGLLPDASQDLAIALAEALTSAIERMSRARSILTNDNPTEACNWGILSATDLIEVLQQVRPGYEPPDSYERCRPKES